MKVIILLSSLVILIAFGIWLCGFEVNNLFYAIPALIIVICASVLIEKGLNSKQPDEPNFHNKQQINYFKGRKTYHDWNQWYDNEEYKNN